MHGIPDHHIKSICHEHECVTMYENFGPWKLRLCGTAKCILEEGGKNMNS